MARRQFKIHKGLKPVEYPFRVTVKKGKDITHWDFKGWDTAKRTFDTVSDYDMCVMLAMYANGVKLIDEKSNVKLYNQKIRR